MVRYEICEWLNIERDREKERQLTNGRLKYPDIKCHNIVEMQTTPLQTFTNEYNQVKSKSLPSKFVADKSQEKWRNEIMFESHTENISKKLFILTV